MEFLIEVRGLQSVGREGERGGEKEGREKEGGREVMIISMFYSLYFELLKCVHFFTCSQIVS